MNLILRGHIRNAFLDNDLYELVNQVSKVTKLRIFAHTWNVKQTGLSWRRIPENLSSVDEKTIVDYFSDLSHLFERIIVEDEKDVPLKGRTEGTVGHTPCPIRAYKYMFHGMSKIAEYAFLNSNPEEKTIQTRFDLFSNWRRFEIGSILDFFAMKSSKKIQFMLEESHDESTVGIDNIYMASAKDMHEFIRHMLENLDGIDERHKAVRHMGHQEWITMFEAIRFNDESASYPPN